MLCTKCGRGILPKQPYARTKKGPHHFNQDQCRGNHQVPHLTASNEEAIRVAAVRYCNEHQLDYTLGVMNEMAKFAIDILIENINAREARGERT